MPLGYDSTIEFNTGVYDSDEHSEPGANCGTALASRDFKPHPSIAKYFNDQGQIQADSLLGNLEIPIFRHFHHSRRTPAVLPQTLRKPLVKRLPAQMPFTGYMVC